MDPSRRTLSTDGPAGNASSSIPVPSSAVKRKAYRSGAGSQMSLASQPYPRASLMENASAGPSHGPRQSLAQHPPKRHMANSARMIDNNSTSSATRGDAGAYGRTPQASRSLVKSGTRRSSVYASAGGRASMAGSYGGMASKDSRPVRDRNFQADCQSNIQEYLGAQKAQIGLSQNALSSPTQRDFHLLFRFLAEQLIGAFPWNGKKFEDDCIAILRDLRYPAMDSVGKTALTAPGSGNAWPNVLAMLNWLVELCKAQSNWYDPDIVTDPLLCSASELPLTHPQLEDRLLWDFASKTYKEWFDGGAEDFTEAETALATAFDRIVTASVDECGRLENEISKKETELRQLQRQEPPLKKIEEEHRQLESDKTKFIAFIDLHLQKADKLRQGIDKTRLARDEQARSLASAKRELSEAEAAVAAQNLSPDEVNRMTHERETLSSNLDDLRKKIQEASQQSYDQEMRVTRSMDRFEQLVQDYTGLAHQTGIMPTPGPDLYALGLDKTNFAIDLDLGAESVNDIQDQGRSTMRVIQPALQMYGEHVRKQASDLHTQVIELDDKFQSISQDVEQKREEMKGLEERLSTAQERVDEAKTHFQAQTAETNRYVSKLELNVTAMSSASEQGVVNTQSHLEGTRIAFQELRHKTQQLQDNLVEQMMGHIDVVIKAKERSLDSLRGVRTYAEVQ